MTSVLSSATYKIVVIGTNGATTAILAEKLGKHSAEQELFRYNTLFPFQDIRVVLDHI
jgi:hypothetical protein